jgi:D-3-phosphoglycerate dehydrogenase
VGYVVIDVETDERAGTAEIRRKLERVPGTIRTRVLY